MNPNKRRDYFNLFVGLIVGMLIQSVACLYFDVQPAPTRAELQAEYDAYRTCMQSAGTTRCQMTPDDFVRYYKIKATLEAETDSSK